MSRSLSRRAAELEAVGRPPGLCREADGLRGYLTCIGLSCIVAFASNGAHLAEQQPRFTRVIP
jgi:hypothetical protein